MKAGQLRHEILEFQELQTTRSSSGALTKVYSTALKTRASKKRLTAIIDKDGINASQQFIGNIIVVQVRYNPIINENMRVLYYGITYAIQLLDKQADNSYLITLKKEN